MASESDRRQQESKRVLDRIEAESATAGPVGRTVRRVENHLGAADADQRDWQEVWGTRIGRTIGAVVTVGAVIWLIRYLLGQT